MFRLNLKCMTRYQQGKRGLTAAHAEAFSASTAERWLAERPSIFSGLKLASSWTEDKDGSIWEASVNTGTAPRHQMPFFFPYTQSDPPRIEWAAVAREEAKRVCHKRD